MPVQLPVQAADYGLAIFSIVALAWTLVTVLRPRRRDRDVDLVKVIADNTAALTRLTAVIEDQGKMIQAQGEVLQRQAELLTELRVEIVRKAG